jgi:hypothetical protein
MLHDEKKRKKLFSFLIALMKRSLFFQSGVNGQHNCMLDAATVTALPHNAVSK